MKLHLKAIIMPALMLALVGPWLMGCSPAAKESACKAVRSGAQSLKAASRNPSIQMQRNRRLADNAVQYYQDYQNNNNMMYLTVNDYQTFTYSLQQGYPQAFLMAGHMNARGFCVEGQYPVQPDLNLAYNCYIQAGNMGIAEGYVYAQALLNQN